MNPLASRLVLCLAGLSLLAVAAVPASAATGPTVLKATDPKGDARGGQADMDILGLTFTTSGTTVTKKIGGKTTKVYTPKRLIMKLSLSAPPSSIPVMQFAIDAVTSKCGNMYLYYDGLDFASGGFTGCGTEGTSGETFYLDAPSVEGNSIVWTQPFTTMPKELWSKASYSEIHAYSSINEPNTGAGSSIVTSAANIDDLVVDKVYKVG